MFMFGSLAKVFHILMKEADSPGETVGFFILAAIIVGVVIWLRHKLWKF